MVSKRSLLFQGLIFRFHVKLQGRIPETTRGSSFSLLKVTTPKLWPEYHSLQLVEASKIFARSLWTTPRWQRGGVGGLMEVGRWTFLPETNSLPWTWRVGSYSSYWNSPFLGGHVSFREVYQLWLLIYIDWKFPPPYHNPTFIPWNSITHLSPSMNRSCQKHLAGPHLGSGIQSDYVIDQDDTHSNHLLKVPS